METLSCFKSASSSFKGVLENSIFMAIGIMGREERPFQRPHLVAESRLEARI